MQLPEYQIICIEIRQDFIILAYLPVSQF